MLCLIPPGALHAVAVPIGEQHPATELQDQAQRPTANPVAGPIDKLAPQHNHASPMARRKLVAHRLPGTAEEQVRVVELPSQSEGALQ